MADRLTLTVNSKQWSSRVARFVSQNIRTADRLTFEVSTNVLSDIQEGWPVDSGASRSAWRGPKKIAAAHYMLTNPLPYARVIERGGYPGVGPLTSRVGAFGLEGGIRVEAGIFPTQKPAAPVRRALAKNRNEIGRRLKLEMQRTWGR